MKEAKDFLRKIKSHNGNVTVLTGAGISTPSGIPDFRSPNGIYSKYDPETLFGLNHFVNDPSYFYSFAKEYLFTTENAKPNAVHHMLKVLEEESLILGVITQNIDMLHEKAGSRNLATVHGSMATGRCLSCEKRFTLQEIVKRSEHALDGVARCNCGGLIKPNVVFFGEPLPSEEVEKAYKMLHRSTLIVAMGTALFVYPVGSFPEIVLEKGGELVVVNRGSTRLDAHASEIYDVSLEEFAKAVLNSLEGEKR